MLVINRGDALTVANTISGSGQLMQAGAGTTALTGTNTYTGGTTIAAGTLQVGDGGTSGLLGTGAVVNDAALAFDRSDVLTVANDIGGSGTLTQIGTGTTILTGTNTYSGGTTISEGTLQVGNGGTAGTLGAGPLVNNGLLTFDRSDAVAVDAISGSGALNQLGTGTTVLTATNTYTGGTTISAGTLQIGGGGTSGTIAGNVTNNAGLAFFRSDDLEFGGEISGMGDLVKYGPGALTLSGDSTYSGATLVKAGALVVNGLLGNTTVSVDSGAMLGGIGRIAGSVNVASGAMLAPGTSSRTMAISSPSLGRPALMSGVSFNGAFGTLNIGGDLRLDAEAQYRVSIDETGQNSSVAVNGSAEIDGATVAIDPLPGSYGRATRYTLLRADGGLTGIATAVSDVPSLEPWLTSTDTTLFMTLLRTDLPLQRYATTVNGAAIGNAFDRLRRNASGDLAGVTRELTALDDPMLASTLDALSGEIHASSRQLEALDGEASMDLVRGEIATRTARAPDVRFMRASQSPGDPPSHWWTQFDAQQATFGGTPSAHGAEATLHRFAFGTHRTVIQKWLVGVGGGYTTGKMNLDGLAESSDFTAPRAFGYFGYKKDRWTTHIGTSLTRTTYDSRRAVRFAALTPLGDALLFGGVDRQPTSHSTGLATDVWSEQRLDAAMGSWSISPSVGLRYARAGRHAWSENGADALSLSAPSGAFSSMQGDGGVAIARTAGRFRPLAAATYRRQLSNVNNAATLMLSGSTDGAFVVGGLPLARDTFVGRAGMTVRAGSSDLSLIYEWRGARAQTRQAFQFSLGFE